MKRILITSVALAIAAMSAWASEITSKQAQTAAENWIKSGSFRMGLRFHSASAQSVKTVCNETGRAVFHAVNLNGGGFVVTSGDTRITPIIAFSDTGCYLDDNNAGPLCLLLQRSLAGAVSAFERTDRQFAAGESRSSENAESRHAGAMAEWSALLSDTAANGDGERLFGADPRMSVSDMRVNKLLPTQWGQTGFEVFDEVKGDWVYVPAFDYYLTSSGAYFPCGSVATAGAQLMYYWQYPTTSMAQFSNTCQVDGKSKTLASIAGTLPWSKMFLTWGEYDLTPSETARQAVGKLARNVAIAIGTKWYSATDDDEAKGVASPEVLVDKIKARFGYSSGTWVSYKINTGSPPSDLSARSADFNNALYASLDAKMPVLMGLSGVNVIGNPVEHAVIADGYGYESGKRYTHLNFGYYGLGDAWYLLLSDPLEIEREYGWLEDYLQFDGLGFNINPTLAGDVISGRVINSASSPVSGATVTIYSSANVALASTTTDSRGIYSFITGSTGNYTVKATQGSLTSASKAVNVSVLSAQGTYGLGGRTGNKWGVDLALGGGETYTVTLDKQGGSGGTSSVKVQYGASMPKISVPTKAGYVFGGYFSGKDGVKPQFYSTAGKSVTAWNRKWNSTIYARWVPAPYTVTFDRQGGSGGSSSVKVAYGFAMPAITVPTKAGYIFEGYFSGKNGVEPQFYNADGTSARTWNREWGSTVYAKWKASPTYTITLNKQGGSGGTSSVKVKYSSAMPAITVPTKAGYIFEGYFSGPDGVAPQYYTADGKSARAWNREWGSTIYAKWKASPTYTVTLDKQGGSGGTSSVKVKYSSAMPAITVPTKAGYIFQGYFSGKNGVDPQFYDKSGKSAHAWNRQWGSTIYAKWAASPTYTITLNKQGGSGGTSSVSVKYSSAMPTITVPTKSGYKFEGYFSGPDGVAPQYYKADGKSARTWNREWGSMIYAKWTKQ